MATTRVRFTRCLAGMVLAFLCMLAFSVYAHAAIAVVGGLKQTGHTETSVQIEWTKLPASAAAEGYNIYLSDTKDGTYKKQFKYNGMSTELEGLKAGRHYFVKVTAVKGKEESDLAATAAVDVTTAPKKKITDLTVTKLSDTSVSLKWNCEQADYYVISGKASLDDDPISFTGTGTAENKITISKLTPRAEYKITITPAMKGSYTAAADDDYEASITFHTLPVKPAAPAIKNAKAGSDGPVKVTLKMPAGISGAEYELYECSSKDSEITPVPKASKKTYRFKVSETGSFYTVRYRYFTGVNGSYFYGDWSPKTYFAVAPAGLTLKRNGKKINVSWKKTAGATSYTIYVSTKKGSGFKKVGTVGKKKLKATIKKYGTKALNKNKKYYVKVVANKNVDGTIHKSAAALKQSP